METFGTSGDDAFCGEPYSTSDNDTIYGRAGNDTLCGLGGNDFLYGDRGNDFLYSDKDNDLLNGGDGIDTVSYNYKNTRGITLQLGEIGDGSGLGRAWGKPDIIVGGGTFQFSIIRLFCRLAFGH